jgi:hypothetical protein
MRAWSYFVIAGALASCSGQSIDAGTNDDGGRAVGARDAGATATPGPSGASEVFKGYIENFRFPSGSDTVVMTLTFGSGGAVTGTVFFGDGPPLAPPTNPDVGYPPGVTFEVLPSPEDFAYTVLEGKQATSRVTLQVNSRELEKKWCELQTVIYPSYATIGGPSGSMVVTSYSCSGSGGMVDMGPCENDVRSGGPDGGETFIPIDCGKLEVCSHDFCTCTATTCTVPLMGTTPQRGLALTTPDLGFDMQLVGNTLSGSVSGLPVGTPDGQLYNVHLTRSP